MTKNLLGIMLASTLSLSALVGCQGGLPSGSAQTSATASSDSGAAAAASMSAERSMDDHATIANQEDAKPAAYGVMQLAAGVTGSAATTATTAVGSTGAGGSATATASGSTTASAPSKPNLDAIMVKIKAGQALGAQEMTDARNAFLATAALSSEVQAKVNARVSAREASIKSRLDRLEDQRTKMRAALKTAVFVDNGDGTSKKTIDIDDERTVHGKKASRHSTLVKIVRNDNRALVSWHAETKQTAANGATRTSTRDKTQLADGGHLVVFHSELMLANGRSRVSDWSKIISVDGGITGKGMIVWKDKAGTVTKTSTITLGGDEDKATAKAEDTGATASMSVDGQTSIKDDDGKTKVLEDDNAASDAEETGDEPASNSKGASTSASANASASASTSTK